MTDRWYCIAILPQHRDKVELHLGNQQFPVFFPEIIIHDTKKIVPMFKGYAFVQFDIERDQWLSINSTYGVIKLVPKHQLHPTPVDVGFTEHLLANNPMPEEELVEWLMKLIEEKAKAAQQEFFTDQIVKMRKSLDPNSPYAILEGRQATVKQVRDKLLEISFLLSSGMSNAIWVSKDAVVPDDHEAVREDGSDHRPSKATRKVARRAVAAS